MDSKLERYLPDEVHTLAAGAAIAEQSAGCILFLHGNLGMGKTTLSRGVLRALGHQGSVKSPTYTLVEPYELASGQRVYHFDLYRLGDAEELEFLGVRDYFDGEALCLVEWPERGEGFLPQADMDIFLTPQLPGRRIELQANTLRGEQVIQAIAQQDWSVKEPS